MNIYIEGRLVFHNTGTVLKVRRPLTVPHVRRLNMPTLLAGYHGRLQAFEKAPTGNDYNERHGMELLHCQGTRISSRTLSLICMLAKEREDHNERRRDSMPEDQRAAKRAWDWNAYHNGCGKEQKYDWYLIFVSISKNGLSVSPVCLWVCMTVCL